MINFILIFSLFGTLYSGQEKKKCFDRVKAAQKELEEALHELESHWGASTQGSENSLVFDQDLPEQKVSEEKDSSFSLTTPDKEGAAFDRKYLEKIVQNLLFEPLNKKDRRNLKYFIRETKDEKLKAEASFFLGEIYLLRKSKQNDLEKVRRDNQKAIESFSKSYDLDPHSKRTHKTLLKIAKCRWEERDTTKVKSLIKAIEKHHKADLNKNELQDLLTLQSSCQNEVV